jgi:hypothetical protein
MELIAARRADKLSQSWHPALPAEARKACLQRDGKEPVSNR